jgi:hypothetical protein
MANLYIRYPATKITGAVTVVQPDGSLLHTTVDSGNIAASQSGTWNINNITGTVSLPTGAATSAKQPALGIAGTASSDVLTVQGISGMVPFKVDASGYTLTVTGTVNAAQAGPWQVYLNAGSNVIGAISNTSFGATQSGTWNINNITGTVSLPTGAATSAKQPALGVAGTASSDVLTIQGIAGMTALTVAQATAANLNATVVGTGTFAVQAAQSGTWNINNVSGTVSLPTGASTSANQTNGTQKTQVVDGSGNVIASTSNALNVSVQNATLAVTQSGTWTVQPGNTANTTPWLTKLNDGTNSFTVKAASTAAVATDTAVVVAVSPNNTISSTRKGSTTSNAPVYNVYSSTNITTAAYTQLVASTTSASNAIDIFDSSGQAMILATGGSGSETIVAYIPPGGGSYRVAIPAATRVAYKALTANATSGYLLIDFWS